MGVGEPFSSSSPSPSVNKTNSISSLSSSFSTVHSLTTHLKVVPQLDGNNSVSISDVDSSMCLDDEEQSYYSDENSEEIDPVTEPAVFEISAQGSLVLSSYGKLSLPDFPLVMALNARSL